MKSNTLASNNHLIAIFMGAKETGGFSLMPDGSENRQYALEFNTGGLGFVYSRYKTEQRGPHGHTAEGLKYRTSWEWLMPVIKKIGRRQTVYAVSMYWDHIYGVFHIKIMGPAASVLIHKKGSSDIQTTWAACVEFIKLPKKQ